MFFHVYVFGYVIYKREKAVRVVSGQNGPHRREMLETGSD